MPFENKIADCPVTCGLIFHIVDEEVPVPLKGVDVNAKIVDFVANVTVQQRWDASVLALTFLRTSSTFVHNSILSRILNFF